MENELNAHLIALEIAFLLGKLQFLLGNKYGVWRCGLLFFNEMYDLIMDIDDGTFFI